MAKHGFKFPSEVVAAVKRHVQKAIDAVDPARYAQEATYTAALVNRMEGVAYDGAYGAVSFEATVFDDRGPKSAENLFGADYAITGTITDGRQTVRKAILVQAKLGHVSDLNAPEREFLMGQIKKMKQLVDAPKVMEVPEDNGRRFPAMISGNRILEGARYTPMDLADYFTARVTTTLDGATDAVTVSAVQESSLNQVRVTAKLQIRAD